MEDPLKGKNSPSIADKTLNYIKNQMQEISFKTSTLIKMKLPLMLTRRCRNKETEKALRLYKIGSARVNQHLDFLELTKKLNKLETFMNVVLNQQQQDLLPFVKENVITLECCKQNEERK